MFLSNFSIKLTVFEDKIVNCSPFLSLLSLTIKGDSMAQSNRIEAIVPLLVLEGTDVIFN